MTPFRLTNLLMIEPAAFGFNAETAATNRFQQVPDLEAPGNWEVASRARSESEAVAAALRAAGIRVCMAKDSEQPVKPDAVFPNNWVSFHGDGTVVLYPMQSPNRRLERREQVIAAVKRELCFVERRRLDFSPEENQGRYLEGTGSLVLDRAARVAYACRSPRTDETLLHEWARQMDYETVVFDARSPDGVPVYHTNVLLWIGTRIAGVGLDWIAPDQRDYVASRLRSVSGVGSRTLLELATPALYSFAGNMLEIAGPDNRHTLAMSATAASCLSANQQAQIREAECTPLVVSLPTIESLGGGSVRCMLAEVPVA